MFLYSTRVYQFHILKHFLAQVKFTNILIWYVLSHSFANSKLTLNVPIATKFICFSRLLKCLRNLYGKQCGPRSDCSYTAPIGAVGSGSMLFASILNSSVMLGNYLQQRNSADNIFRCIFFLGALKVLWNFKNFFETLHDLNDSDEKTEMLKTPS